MIDKLQALYRYFGYSQFRPGQEVLIDGILAGRDVFGIMPTGGGKSICYQLPALLLPGITLVISPLISLMRDQVLALKEAGIPAAYLNSTLTHLQMQAACRNLRAGQYKIVYISPERLDYSGFLELISGMNISLIAVDEAHCISQWGQDFRPSYLRIVNFIDSLPRRPVVGAFTATATRQVQQDVQRILKLRSPALALTGFDRPNLFFDVLRPDGKSAELLRLLALRRGKSGIVYCSTRKNVENVCQLLCDHGYPATRYHAGLEEQERGTNQEDFLYDRKTVMVATNAFGMGIDKSNVSFVIHYNMPKSIEAYYQEAGRAGRDGSDADCILLFSDHDVSTARFLISNASENEELTPEQAEQIRRQDLARLEAMVGYCKTDTCLRGYILEYFGQQHPEVCGSCGNCSGAFQAVDVTRESQMILSCVKRVHDKLGSDVGFTLISQTLRGSRDRRVLSLGLDSLSTYGLLRSCGRSQVRAIANNLEAKEYLATDPELQTVHLTAAAGQVLYRGQKVEMLERIDPEPERTAAGLSRLSGQEADLLDLLKELRLELAQEHNVPAYVVFSDATLTDIVRKKPRNMTQFRKVSGVGEIKSRWYGQAFLTRIREYLEQQE